VLHQFENDEAKVAWAYSYMKTGRAALFVNCMLCYEARSSSPHYTNWVYFYMAFKDEFFPKNECQHVLTHLETPTYHQNKHLMNKYIDKFHNLIKLTGYKEGLAVIMKFCTGFWCNIQHIAQLAQGRCQGMTP
jgi:hypothetical protein